MANGFQGPPVFDFYSSLSGLGDTLQANQKKAALQEALTGQAQSGNFLSQLGGKISGAVSSLTGGEPAPAQAAPPVASGGPDLQAAIPRLIRAGYTDEAAKLASIQKSLSPESSADLQAYNLYSKQETAAGRTPMPFLPFKTKLAEAGATRVNNSTSVTNSGEKEFDKAVGKDYGETFVGINKAARDSVGALNNLNLMEKITQDPNFYSGAGGEAVTKAKQLAASLGIADAATAAPNELFKKISQKSVLDAAGGSLGAGFSNADRSFLEGTVANIGNTPEGNRQIIGIARRVEQRKQEVAQFARDYAKKNGGRIDAGFDTALAEWTAKNPAFPQASGAQRGQQQPQATPVPNAPRQAPDGNFYVPDPNRPGKYLQVIQ